MLRPWVLVRDRSSGMATAYAPLSPCARPAVADCLSQGGATVSAVSENDTGRQLRQAALLGAGGSEDTMYPPLVEVLKHLLPPGFEARSHASAESGRPDISAVQKASGAPVAHIEVKLEATLSNAFAPDASDLHQVGRYREAGLPVLLTDAVRWFDVTDPASGPDALTVPLAHFDGSDDDAAEQQLRGLLHSACRVRPKHTDASAVAAMSGVVAQINSAVGDQLSEGWRIIREELGFDGEDSLDDAGVGEIIAFTLLSIAVHLPALPAQGFVAEATSEWEREDGWGDQSKLPLMMQRSLDRFRLDLNTKKALGVTGWQTIRAIAYHVASGNSTDRWSRLSSLWDNHLQRAGRRAKLGSWQTPEGLARYQANETHEALKRLGYSDGLGDNDVTIIDPCVGTGVYLEAVLAEAAVQGHPAERFNADLENDDPAKQMPRLLGADISPTAVAACQIRMAPTRARPLLYMTDTLRASGAGDAAELLDPSQYAPNELIDAAHRDWQDVTAWASRDSARDPILAVIGNPPYQRSGIDHARYDQVGWRSDVFEQWRAGSGGGGSLDDLFVAFWAWAINVCRQPHASLRVAPGLYDDDDDQPCRSMWGVVSFVTNRTWIVGKTFGPMRSWVRSRAARIDVTDFGPGSRGGGAGRWSEQPFPIQTGTAVVTLTFDPHIRTRQLYYRRAVWSSGRVTVIEGSEDWHLGYDPEACGEPWGTDTAERDLLAGIETVNGVKTGNDEQFISVGGTRTSLRHAYRSLDNRWSPATAPEKAKRGDPVPAGMASGYAEWRREKLFDPHKPHVEAGGWYAILPAIGVQAGPAIHATNRLPDYHLFKGSEGGKVVHVAEEVPVPEDYQDWAESQDLDGADFWLYALAVANHPDYWREGTERADSLAGQTVELPITDDPTAVSALVGIGRQLVDVWSVDGLTVDEPGGGTGAWKFEGHNEVEDVKINGYPVLQRWRKARPGVWDTDVAEDYARTVKALVMLLDLSKHVGELID